MSVGALLGVAIGIASLSGCGSSPAVLAAERGDYVVLRRTVNEDLRLNKLSADDARDIARAVASREVERADAATGADRLRDLQSCARPISGALERRAAGSDELAAIASLILLEEGLMSAGDAAARAQSAERAAASTSVAAAWRAVRARTLTKPEDGSARRALLLDGDQEVRAAAAMASLNAASQADTEALIEAARLDPYPAVRTLAIRALGAIGGEAIVVALKDLWAGADDPKRQVIVSAWASPPTLEAGGRRELTLVAESQPGTPGLAAAIALARAGGEGSASASSVIARAVASGSTLDRVYAISASPLGSTEVRDAIVKAQSDTDDEVAIAALSRRLEAPGAWGAKDSATARGEIVAKLLRRAKDSQDSARGRKAKGALARGGVSAVIPLLERDVQSKDEAARQEAGLSFVALKDLPRATAITADAEARVRVKVACAILRTER